MILVLNLLFVILDLLNHGDTGVHADVLSVMDGDSVTLPTGVHTNQQERIRERIEDLSVICTDVQCNKHNESFRDRLKLDHQTGSLTVMKIRPTVEEDYQPLINGSKDKIFNVTVHDAVTDVLLPPSPTTPPGERHGNKNGGNQTRRPHEEETGNQDRPTLGVRRRLWRSLETRRGVTGVHVSVVLVTDGDSVTLLSGVQTNQQDHIKWYFNNIRIAQINRDLSVICTDVQCNKGTERFRDRLKLDIQTGSLTITNTTKTDDGDYQLLINGSIYKIFNVTVHDAVTDVHLPVSPTTPPVSGLSAGGIAVVVVCSVFLVVGGTIGVICYQRRRNNRPAEPNGNESIDAVPSEGEVRFINETHTEAAGYVEDEPSSEGQALAVVDEQFDQADV